MKVKEVISLISNTDYYSLIEATRAVGLYKDDIVVENYNITKHKYFNIVTNIYQCEDGFVAITGLKNNIKKKDYEEFNIAAFAEEYIEIPTVMYAPKYRR